jgi:hypothetical protein
MGYTPPLPYFSEEYHSKGVIRRSLGRISIYSTYMNSEKADSWARALCRSPKRPRSRRWPVRVAEERSRQTGHKQKLAAVAFIGEDSLASNTAGAFLLSVLSAPAQRAAFWFPAF